MRLSEVTAADPHSAKLAALSQFLIGRAEDTASTTKISTDAFLKLASSMGVTLTLDQLIAQSQKPPLSNIIVNMNQNEVIFKGKETTAASATSQTKEKEQDTVSKLAKRAASKRT